MLIPEVGARFNLGVSRAMRNIKLVPLFNLFRQTLSKAPAGARSAENHSSKLTLFSSEVSVFCSLA